jgi:hypothetical protein
MLAGHILLVILLNQVHTPLNYFIVSMLTKISIHSGMTKGNGVGGGPLGNSRAFHEEGFNSSREHLRSLVPSYPGRYDPKNTEENMKQFPGPTHLDGEGFQRGPRPFDGLDSLPGRPPFPNKPGPYPIGFPEDLSRKPHSVVGHPDFVSPGAEFGLHRIDGMPRNPGKDCKDS